MANKQEQCLFDQHMQEKKVRDGVTAYKYRNGTIVIDGTKYLMHTMTSAIKAFREAFPARKKG